MLIYMVYVYSHKDRYWMVNGLLMAFCAGGIIVQANVKATVGLPYLSPTHIIFLFICMVFIFVEAGDVVDGIITNKTMNNSVSDQDEQMEKKYS